MKNFVRSMLCMLILCVVGCEQPAPEENTEVKPEVILTAGLVTENTIEFNLSAEDADEVAYSYVENVEDEIVVHTPESLFNVGEVFAATVEPVSHELTDLDPATGYVIYAAARKNTDDAVVYSDVRKLEVTTSSEARLLEFIDASKTGFSYKINSDAGEVYYHTYLEGWFFEYNYELNKYIEGSAFDTKVFICNLLAEYGAYAETPQEYEWYAGMESTMRNEYAFLVPGTRYYVLASRFNEESGEGWVGNPEIIEVVLDAPGKSDKTIDCSVDNVSPYSVSIRMESNEQDVIFYMYTFHEKSQYDEYVAENGIEGMMRYVSEYSLGLGQAKVNTYTDTWSVTPGTTYMLCVYGVDYEGDEFYTELEVEVPMPEAELNLWMEPYERDMEGLNTYNTLSVSCTMANFINLDYAESVYYMENGLLEKDSFDAILEEHGISGTYEEIQAKGDEILKIAEDLGLAAVSDENFINDLAGHGKHSWICTSLKPDTEYACMMLVKYNGQILCRIAVARTDPAPADVEESDAYKAFLGNWTVTGQKTTTWSNSDRATFNLTFERLTSNRSYKVYGWSASNLGQEFPFEVSFEKETGKLLISTPQILGEVEIDGRTYEVRFVGKARNDFDPDNYMVLHDHDGLAYKGTLNEPYIHLITEFFQYGGSWKEYKSLSYIFYDRETDEYFASEEYDLVAGFQIMRAN